VQNIQLAGQKRDSSNSVEERLSRENYALRCELIDATTLAQVALAERDHDVQVLSSQLQDVLSQSQVNNILSYKTTNNSIYSCSVCTSNLILKQLIYCKQSIMKANTFANCFRMRLNGMSHSGKTTLMK
jgi:hypothetical protein